MQLLRSAWARMGRKFPILCLLLIGFLLSDICVESQIYADPDYGAWGAIAIDREKNVGGAGNNYPSAAEAATAAIKMCQHDGGNHCRALLTFHGCAAVIRAHDKFYYGQAPYSLRGESDAIGRAMFTYRLHKGDFHVLASTCNYPLQTDPNG